MPGKSRFENSEENCSFSWTELDQLCEGSGDQFGNLLNIPMGNGIYSGVFFSLRIVLVVNGFVEKRLTRNNSECIVEAVVRPCSLTAQLIHSLGHSQVGKSVSHSDRSACGVSFRIQYSLKESLEKLSNQ